MRNSSKRSD